MQLIVPKKGQPYIKYRDHAYHNLESKDTDEVPDFLSKFASDTVHSLRDITQILSGNIRKTSPNQSIDDTPNTGAMKHYPSNIRGDVSKTVIIPYSEFPSSLKKRINDRIPIKSGEKSQASSLASQASSAVGLRRNRRGRVVESTWSRLKEHQKKG